MAGLTAILLLLVVLLVVGVGGFALALARRGTRRRDEAAQLLPGVTTRAPASWGVSRQPEAVLHRRLAAALQGLRAQAALAEEDVQALELRVELEQHGIALDDRLVAAAALPQAERGRTTAELEVAVAAVEQAAGDLAAALSREGASADVRGLEDLGARIRALGSGG